MAIIIKPPVSGGGGGGGAVDSVNGATGVVVLTTDNIDAGSNADRQYFTTSIQSDIDSKADQSSLDTVQGKTLYSNSYYVNEGVNDIQTVVNAIAGGSGAYAIYMSAGSYGGSTLTISDAPSGMDIIAPYHPTSGHICELVSRGLTISGASTTRVRINDLNIEGAVLIDGTLGRHYFKNCTFDSTVTITNATANFVTFEQCSFAGGISIASSVTATVYFDRCTMGNQLVTSLRAGAGSPLLTVLTECSGVNALQVNLTSNVVLVGRTGFNDLSVVQYQNSDSYVYDLNNGLSTSFSGSYTELRNKPTIPSAYTDEQARDAAGTALANGAHAGISFVNNDGGDTIDATVSLASFSTDNLAQGSTNKYFSDTLARGAFTAGTGISITTGTIASTITQYTDTLAKTASVVNSMTGTQTDQAPSVSSIKAYYTAGTGISLTGGTIASTITQYTDADADARITAQKGQANGICELDANSLVPTNHLPPLAITDVHVVADATERLALTVQEGDVAIQTDDSSAWIYSGTAWVQFSTGGAVLSVNGQTGTVSLDTDDVSEGATNKYFSDTLARGAFTAGTGISITTGTIASTITQYTDEQARDAVGTALANGSHTGISFVNNDGGDTIDATVSLASFSTDNLAQGSTNKYFSDTLARGAFTAGTGISITTGTIASTITQYTDTLAKTASVVNSMTGTQTDQAPSVSSVKAYYTAGAGISLTGGTIASTITQYTDADADARITAQKGQANGVCELDANSLVPTNHLPPLAITDVHVVADATERLALTVQEGDVAIQTDDSSAWIYSGTAWVQFSTGGAVLSVNGQTGTVSLDTDDVTEGATNKYFSDTLARGAFTAGTGISITTGTIASTITQYTDTLAKTASVVNSMAGTQTDQAPSVSSVKAYYTAGTGISLTGGAIASTITQYTDELAQDASASLLTTGTHTGISYSYVDGSNKIDSTVSLAGFSIDALSDVDTSTTPPTSGQALAWDGTSKWIPTTIGGSAGGGSRPSYTTVSSFPLTISAPASSVIKERYYLDNNTSAVTVNLPAISSCDGLEIVIKLLGTGTATIDASGSETIDGALTFALSLQNSSVNLIATSAGWRIE